MISHKYENRGIFLNASDLDASGDKWRRYCAFIRNAEKSINSDVLEFSNKRVNGGNIFLAWEDGDDIFLIVNYGDLEVSYSSTIIKYKNAKSNKISKFCSFLEINYVEILKYKDKIGHRFILNNEPFWKEDNCYFEIIGSDISFKNFELLDRLKIKHRNHFGVTGITGA